jgi:hypothetical protein
MWLGILLVCASVTLAQDGVRPIPSAKVDADRHARALALGVRIFDDSVREMEWRQTAKLDEDNTRSDELISTQRFDEAGRWDCRTLARSYSADNDVWAERGERFVYDGQHLYTANESNGTGVLKGYAGERRTQVGIDCWMGRHMDVAATRRLSDLLLDATDLSYVGESSTGLPIIAATISVLSGIFELEVEVDVMHGCAPRTITVRDRAVRVPFFHYEVLEIVNVGEVWLPKRGRLTTRAFSPTEREMAAFNAALAERKLSRATANFRDAAVQATYREVVREVWGGDEGRSEPLTTPILVEAEYIHLNHGELPSGDTLDLFVEYELLDMLEGRLKPPGSRKWRPMP